MVKKFIFLLVFALPIHFCLAGQIIELEKIVVTPYRYTKKISETFTSVTIIDESDFQESGALTVLDALRTVPGGYEEASTDRPRGQQFPISDHRPPAEVAAWLRSAGIEPVWEIAERTGY